MFDRVVEVRSGDEVAVAYIEHVPIPRNLDAAKNLACGVGSYMEPLALLHVEFLSRIVQKQDNFMALEPPQVLLQNGSGDVRVLELCHRCACHWLQCKRRW